MLWLDAHGDFNTPDTTRERLPRRHVPGRRLRRVGRRPRRQRSPPSGWCWPACATSTRRARAARAQRGDRDRRQRVETLVAVEERARRRARLRPPRPRRARPGGRSRPQFPAPGGLPPDKLYDLLEAVAEDCELVGLEVTAFEAPEDEEERAVAAETAMHVLEPLLDGDRRRRVPGRGADARARRGRHARRAPAAALARRGPARAPRAGQARRRRGEDRPPARAGQADRARAARAADRRGHVHRARHPRPAALLAARDGGQGGAGRRRGHRLRQGRRPAGGGRAPTTSPSWPARWA